MILKNDFEFGFRGNIDCVIDAELSTAIADLYICLRVFRHEIEQFQKGKLAAQQ